MVSSNSLETILPRNSSPVPGKAISVFNYKNSTEMLLLDIITGLGNSSADSKSIDPSDL